MSISSTEAKLNDVLSTIKSLEDNISSADEMKFLAEVGYPQLLKEVASVTERMPTYDELSDRSKFRLDNISEATISYAKLDFSFVPYVNENPVDHFDFIGTALNMMRYEMERNVQKLSWYKEVFNGLYKPVLITDSKGVVLEANQTFNKSFKDPESLIGQPIKHLIAEESFKKMAIPSVDKSAKYSIELDPMFSTIKDHKGKTAARVYTFNVELNAQKSADEAMIALKKQVIDLAEKFKTEVNNAVDEGVDKLEEKEKFLHEIKTSLSDKKSTRTLSTTESAWLSHLHYLLD